MDEYLKLYDTWSRYEPEERGVLIVYGSFHGNTKCAAEYLATLLQEKGFEPLAYRYFCLNSHYKSKLNFTFEKEETEDKTDPYITESLIYNSGEKKWSVLKDGYELELENQCVLKDGYELKLDNSTLDQNGHNVTWTLTIDTEKNGIVAAADVNLVVEAVDHTEKKDTNKATANKQVDVPSSITRPFLLLFVLSDAKKRLGNV